MRPVTLHASAWNGPSGAICRQLGPLQSRDFLPSLAGQDQQLDQAAERKGYPLDMVASQIAASSASVRTRSRCSTFAGGLIDARPSSRLRSAAQPKIGLM